MATEIFNPFTDRLSRDIRNGLSETLPQAIAKQSITPAQEVADSFLTEGLPAPYQDYIDERLDKYRKALALLPDNKDNYLKIATLLWDLGLHFEVHEILEPYWIKASGERKLWLQALIRAAGVYINLELGYQERAAKIAGKAIPVLKQFQPELQKDLNAKLLITALENLDPQSPLIRSK